ncbi:MAG: dimethylsulfonioproprionate lyase family protein [Pseudomonadota bacterium]
MTHQLNMSKLSQDVDIYYLLREFDVAYRYASYGGSAAIRAHMRRVRDRISKLLKSDPQVQYTVPSRVPANAHLARALDNGEQDAAESFVRAVTKVADRFMWQYGYEKLPASLAQKYGYADIVGPGGLIQADDLALGFVLFAPNCVYPSHKHDGIMESYIVLSGACSQNDIGVFRAPSLIFNAPGTTHTIRTPSTEPVLLAYAWTAEPEDLAAHKMKFTKRRKPRI